MILPPAFILGAHLLMPVADSVPTLNVGPVCQGIAQQGGVTFRDSATGDDKQSCIDSEKAVREQLVKEWPTFAPADRTACTNELLTGGEFELHRASDLSRNGARRPGDERQRKRRRHADPAGASGTAKKKQP